ncbi:MAG: hypothetical protein V3V08_20930 [Nannocystaceae bacterium]
MRNGPLALAILCLALAAIPGCSKIRSRDLVREGNQFYNDGRYEQAVAKYTEAQEHEPGGVTLLWNRACAAESIVLPLKEADQPEKLERRHKYANIALSDFQAWYNALEVQTAEDDKMAREHRLAVLSADSRCDDLITHWQEKLQTDPKAEGLYSVIARTYDDVCQKPEKAAQWYEKRAEDFPQSAQAWHTLAVRTFAPLFPDPESGLPYNGDMTPDARVELADRVIGYLNHATKVDAKYRDPYVWRSMSYMQRQLARIYNDPPQTDHEALQALLAREDSMLAWKEQRAVCDIDELPNCPMPVDVAKLQASPGAFAGRGVSVTAKVVVASIRPGGPLNAPVVDLTLVGGLQVRHTFPAMMAGEHYGPEQLAGFVELSVARWQAGKSDTFKGKLSADGVVLASSAAPVLGCCPLPPLTPEEQAADNAQKQELREVLAGGGKRGKRRKGRRRRRG